MKNDMPLLKAEQIEVKVAQVTRKGAGLLLYKTARTDMDILDEVFGAENWQNDYQEIKGNLYCGIAVRDENGEWIWKWDCGTESRADKDGNEKKGEASDAFKRAGFRWGIGRELYTAPFVFWNTTTVKSERGYGYELSEDDRYTRFKVSEIGYDENRRINRLSVTTADGTMIFHYPRGTAKASKPASTNPAVILPIDNAPPLDALPATNSQRAFLLGNLPADKLADAKAAYGDKLERMTQTDAGITMQWLKTQERRREKAAKA